MAAADAEDITIWTAWALGAVQGLTEFLPVSSSGHLTLGQSLAGLPDVEQNLAFDIFLHVATLLVVVVMLRKELIQIVRKHPRLLVLVVIGTVPGGVAGLFLDEHMAGLKTPLAVGVFWLVMGATLIVAERTAGQGAKDLGAIGVRDAVLIGLAQMLALMPGISRSGMTILAGLHCGLTREAAFTFSFALYVPIVLGAAILKAPDIGQQALGTPAPLAAGFLAAVIFGAAALWLLRRAVIKRRLAVFGVYCLAVGAITLVAVGFNWIE